MGTGSSIDGWGLIIRERCAVCVVNDVFAGLMKSNLTSDQGEALMGTSVAAYCPGNSIVSLMFSR